MIHLIEQVNTELGSGHTESVYHRALEVLMRLNGIQYESERIVPIEFHGHCIGNVRPDIVTEDTIIELKSKKSLSAEDTLQLRTYMKLLGKPKGILVNFGTFEVIQLE